MCLTGLRLRPLVSVPHPRDVPLSDAGPGWTPFRRTPTTVTRTRGSRPVRTCPAARASGRASLGSVSSASPSNDKFCVFPGSSGPSATLGPGPRASRCTSVRGPEGLRSWSSRLRPGLLGVPSVRGAHSDRSLHRLCCMASLSPTSPVDRTTALPPSVKGAGVVPTETPVRPRATTASSPPVIGRYCVLLCPSLPGLGPRRSCVPGPSLPGLGPRRYCVPGPSLPALGPPPREMLPSTPSHSPGVREPKLLSVRL